MKEKLKGYVGSSVLMDIPQEIIDDVNANMKDGEDFTSAHSRIFWERNPRDKPKFAEIEVSQDVIDHINKNLKEGESTDDCIVRLIKKSPLYKERKYPKEIMEVKK